MDDFQIFDGLRLPLAILLVLVATWIMSRLIATACILVKVRKRKLKQMEAVIQHNLMVINNKFPTRDLIKRCIREQLQLEAWLTRQCFLVNHVGRLPGSFFQGIAERAEARINIWRKSVPHVVFWSSQEVPCLVRRYPHPTRPGEIYYGLYDRFELYKDLV